MSQKQWSFLIPTHYSGTECLQTARSIHQALRDLGHAPGSFEILLLPNGENGEDPRALAHALRSPEADDLPTEVFVLPQPPIAGKGSALRAGVKSASGRWIAMTDADLPYRLHALGKAEKLLLQGYDWITLNRRTAESTFTLPLDLLPIAFGRHRLGLLFNRAVRTLFGIQTRDTQSGLKFFDGEFARAAFERVSSPTFFYDVELFLVSQQGGFDRAEIPAELTLRDEKSTVRLLRDATQALCWLGRIWIQNRRGRYRLREIPHRIPSLSARQVSQLYSASERNSGRIMSLKERLFLSLRWALTPYAKMLTDLPPRARIWDIGSGHGLLELLAASSKREILALDHDANRVQAAQSLWASPPLLATLAQNVRFELGHLPDLPESTCDALLAIDVLHYFSPEEQRTIIQSAWERLTPNGLLVVREVEPQGQGLASRFNQLYEKWSTKRGLTRSKRKTQLFFRTERQWKEFFESFGFQVQSRSCSHPLFADILYVCQKTDAPL